MSKTVISLDGPKGNVFVALGSAVALLKLNGLKDTATRLCSRVSAAPNYIGALAVIQNFMLKAGHPIAFQQNGKEFDAVEARLIAIDDELAKYGGEIEKEESDSLVFERQHLQDCLSHVSG